MGCFLVCYVLQAIKKERFAGLDWDGQGEAKLGIRAIAKQIADAVLHLHTRKLVHGDLKPLNVMRSHERGNWQLIDLDASVRMEEGHMVLLQFFCVAGQDSSFFCVASRFSVVQGAKYSSSVLPPEMIHVENDVVAIKMAEQQGESKPPYELVKATSKFDSWSISLLAHALEAPATLTTFRCHLMSALLLQVFWASKLRAKGVPLLMTVPLKPAADP